VLPSTDQSLGEMSDVYTVPNVASSSRKLMGKKDLTDASWTEIKDLLTEKGDYRFFKVVVAWEAE